MTERKHLILRRNFSWTLVGNALYAAAQWGMVTVLAKLGTPEMLGKFALGLAITAPVVMFTNLQLQTVQATDARHQYRFGDYLALRLITTTVALGVISGIVYLGGYQRETALVILVIALAKAFESISDVFYGQLLQNEAMDCVAKSMIARGLLSLIALSLVVYFTGSIVWGTVGLACIWAIVLLVYDVRKGALVLNTSPQPLTSPALKKVGSIPKLQPHWAVGTLGKLLRLTLPLGFVVALISLNTNIPRYFIDQYLGQRELGIFAALAYVMIAGYTLMLALGQSASPRLARHYAARDAEFRVLLFKLVGIGALLGVAGVLGALLMGREVLTLLYGPEYAEYTDVFIWLMIAAGINYVVAPLGYGMTAARHFRIQMPIFAAAGVVCGAACLWLVPVAGLQGAAMALIVAAAVQLCGASGVIVYVIHTLHSRVG